ncbi:response regulator [Thermodesulfovibrio yellowstonii]|uniref:Response regulator n=1 Tax=Thermodesulfovibrio yellowstonii TaxID=28262 RepID=A0A9W6LKQ3_9BACT|nr:response regulator [Thermodesulfovibrio islandicus]GLI53869.1 response regulator [Thermodesulfovibrio islandicus]
MEKLKILLVDDEVDFVTTLSERLSMREYDVKFATSSIEAMPLFYSCSPHLIILDIRMPEMNGIEFLKLIKKINPAAEVIMLTAYGDVKYVEEAMKEGALEYIIKPIDIKELIIKIERVREKIKQRG